MARSKHMNEQSESEHGGKLWWHGGIGGGNIPFRGKFAPMLTQNEWDTDIQVVRDFKAELFDLSDQQQLKRYQMIMDRVANHWYQVIYIDRKLVPEQKTCIVYLEWVQRYGQLTPDSKAQRKTGDVYQFPQQQAATLPLAGFQPGGEGVG